MTQLIATLHHLHQQYAYLPLFVFLVALIIAVVSFYNPKEQTRYLGYGVAILLVVCLPFIL